MMQPWGREQLEDIEGKGNFKRVNGEMIVWIVEEVIAVAYQL
jgi:hypothetical protein